MSGGVAAAAGSPLSAGWRRLRQCSFWMPAADAFAVLTAASLPWSTSLTGIFSACWIGSAAMVVDYPQYFRSLRQPACALPLALFALAVVGMAWSEASWDARFHAASPAVKLLFLPGLFHHFARSSRGMWVFAAFLVSCVLLMMVSWLVVLVPGLSLQGATPDLVAPQRGVFVKNYIDQSQEFALCAVALCYPVVVLLRDGKIRSATLLAAVALGFLANLVFVIVSRTALVTMPVMLAVFAALHLRWRTSAMVVAAATLGVAAALIASPHLRSTATSVLTDYQLYKERNLPTSGGLRLEYWRKSLQFIADAPLAGHGTGSTRKLFERAAEGVSADTASGYVIDNPHNQTLHVAVQWGLPAVVLLWAMWASHLWLFRGDGMVAWIGLLVVVQNIASSMLNSHLFDFHEGWMYVLGVGVAGGMVQKQLAISAGEPA